MPALRRTGPAAAPPDRATAAGGSPPPAPGVVESVLTAAALARLPASAPPAPWTVTVSGALWLQRATEAARDAARPLAPGRDLLPVTVGAVLRYAETPVGPYDEVFAAPAVTAELPLPAAVIAFMAVDSAASVRAGRANWALPKVFARFDWSAPPGTGPFAVGCVGEDAAVPWRIGAVVRPRRRGLGVRLPARVRQPAPGGRFSIGVAGALRPATVDVAVDGAELPAWLSPGRHPGLVLTEGRMRIAPGRP